MSSPNLAGLPGPDTLQFQQWALIAVEQLAEFGIPHPPADESAWSIWASNFSNGVIPGCAAPDPYGFNRWQDWAHALVGTIS